MNINIEAKENEEDLIAINNIDISNDNKKKEEFYKIFKTLYTNRLYSVKGQSGRLQIRMAEL